jgi:lipoprotein-anchoring transpeptidase ErfK/SrfK
MRKITRVWTAAALAAIVPLGLAACTTEPRFVSNVTTPTPTAEPIRLTVTPGEGATKQPVSTEIGITVTGGKVTDVELTVQGGGKINGWMRADGSSWVPASPLTYAKSYTAMVRATGPSGQVDTKTTSFTTMDQPSSTIESGLYLFDDQTYGVAMPVVVDFSPGIRPEDRAVVQSRMFVRTYPPQPGTWHWVSNGEQAYYRAPQYWQPGSTISARIALEGIPLSNGRYGNVDRTATARIGGKLELKIDNATKKMSVYESDRLVRTLPVSLGKEGTPSSSGTMVVMEKKETTVFDTRTDPNPENRYVAKIDLAQRLTWGGEYIHAAPWSVQDQGRRNVSHGCVNVSTANAQWLFGKTKIGDPVTVTGSESTLAAGNGWTAWNMSWEEFIKGSALPVPPVGAPGGSDTATAAPIN